MWLHNPLTGSQTDRKIGGAGLGESCLGTALAGERIFQGRMGVHGETEQVNWAGFPSDSPNSAR